MLNLKLKMILGFSILMLAGLLVSGLVGYHFSSNKLYELTLASMKQRLESYKPLIRISDAESFELAREQMTSIKERALGEIQFIHDQLRRVTAKNQMTQDEVQFEVPDIYIRGSLLVGDQYVDEISSITGQEVTLFSMSPKGLYRVSTTIKNAKGERAVGTFIPPQSPVYQSVQRGETYIGRAMVVGQNFITAYEPIRAQGKVVGALFLGKPDRNMSRILDYLKDVKISSSGYIFIINSKGEMVEHPTLRGKNVLETKDEDGTFIFKEIIAQKNGLINYTWKNAKTQQGEEIYAFFEHFPEMDWYVTARVPKAEVESELKSLKWTLLSLITFLMLSMVLLTTVFGVWISKRLSKVAEELGHASVLLSANSEGLAKQSDQLANTSAQAAASIQESVASLEEIKSQVITNSHSTKEASLLGGQALSVTRDGELKMGQVLQIMKKIEADSKAVQEMSQMIDDVAFQTNLLSLNASVEAARAGEAGRGFSVVAEAVRSLANRAADSARKISDLTHQSHATIEVGVEKVRESESALKEILQKVESLSSLIQTISEASAEQAKGVEQVTIGMNQLDQTTQSNAAVAEEISATAGQLREENVSLDSSVQSLLVLVHGNKNKVA